MIIGKWHLGYQSWAYTPTYRGFNYFYGFYNAMVGYYDKLTQAGFFDLQENMALVTDPAAISSSTHITELLQAKATLAIASHALSVGFLFILACQVSGRPRAEVATPSPLP